MYQRLRQGLRALSGAHRGVDPFPRPTLMTNELETEAWRWLTENGKIGVGDLVRRGRWSDALMFLNFVTSSYRSTKRDSSHLTSRGYLPPSILSTSRGKQAIIEAMISCQVTIYGGLQLAEFIDLPIEECANPLLIAAKIIAAATGCSTVHPSRVQRVEAMSSRDAWALLQSLLTRVNGTRSSIRRIRDWAYRLASCDRNTLLQCAADFRGRIRRSMVPVIITIFYTAVKDSLRLSEEMAWSSLQEIVGRMSIALRSQMSAYIYSHRKLGYFHAYNLGPTKSCLNDNYLKVCDDILSDLPPFLWHHIYQSLTEKYKISMERRKRVLSRPSTFQRPTPSDVVIFNDIESSDDFTLDLDLLRLT